MTFHNHWFVDLRVSNCELHRWIHKLVTSLVHHVHPVPAPRPRYPELWRWNVWPVHESGEISTKTKNGFWEDGKNMFGHKSNIKQVPWKSIERCWKFLVDSQNFLKNPKFTLTIPARKHHVKLCRWEYCNCHLSFASKSDVWQGTLFPVLGGLLIYTSPSSIASHLQLRSWPPEEAWNINGARSKQHWPVNF